MNLKKEEIEQGLHQAQIEPEKAKEAINYFEQLVEDKKKDPSEKKEYRLVGITYKGEEYEKLPITERPLIILKREVDDRPVESVIDDIRSAAIAHNTGKKTKKNPVETVNGTLFECTAKNLRENNVNVQYDGQLYVIEVDQDLGLPTDLNQA